MSCLDLWFVNHPILWFLSAVAAGVIIGLPLGLLIQKWGDNGQDKNQERKL